VGVETSRTQMPEVVTPGTPEVERALVIGVVGVELSTSTTIGFAAKPSAGTGAVSCGGLAAMEFPSHTSRASGWTRAVMQCMTAPSELRSVAVMVSMFGGRGLRRRGCGVGFGW
jgi:hypothetical protein